MSALGVVAVVFLFGWWLRGVHDRIEHAVLRDRRPPTARLTPEPHLVLIRGRDGLVDWSERHWA